MRKLAEVDGATGRAEARLDRLADRYLDVVKAALLDEHYLENEVRLDYLHSCASHGKEPDPLKLRDPRTWLPQQLRRLREARRTGTPVRALAERPIFPYATVGRTGLDHLQECLDAIRDESMSGDLAACGPWRGGVAIFMRAFLEAHEVEEPVVWVADSFSGPPESAGDVDPKLDPKRFPHLVADLNMVREGFARFGLLDERVRFLQGSLPDTLADAPIGELALLHVGDGLEETTAEALDRLYERLVPGGFVVIEHYDASGCRAAVERFRVDRGISEPVRRLDWTGASWRRSPAEPAVATTPPAVGQLNRAPLLAPVGERDCDLSVVVVFHNMRREASRTLQSLSRSYQREIEDLDYEVIAVENGSSEDERLGAELVHGFGPQFRYLELGSDSKPSPAHALNRGMATARGRTIALMVDGAHMLSPGVLRFAMLGLETYAPAIVTTHQWFLGPGQQPQTMEGGYDQDYEDRLLEQIGWPGDGYRLFEIGNCIGDHDWFDGLWESNCLFTPRELLEQVGGFDETFSMPGGGYTNLDLFERLGSTPGVTVVGLLGEASFHQLHGGTTTNQPDVGERHARLMAYRDHYEKVRKRPFRGPGKPRHYVGTVTGAALRTRPRWVTSTAFGEAQPRGADVSQQEPIPVPDQLRAEFTEAVWRSLAWRDTTWLGRRVQRAPTDLIAYQELIASLRPDWIVEVRTAGGARALYLASICELVGSGRVLAIQARRRGVLPEHPRITYLTGPPSGEEMRRRVFETVGEGAKALVVIAPANRKVVLDEFEAYAPLVPVGSFVIVENTVLNGHPVQPTYGPGPAEAVQVILKRRRDFVPDHRFEKFGFSFNPRGFLRRVE